ncbi:unnamed protein product [Closterium sp. Yama58-4]|nr:unnamed protein product [Closterium sp. Yama58-4]
MPSSQSRWLSHRVSARPAFLALVAVLAALLAGGSLLLSRSPLPPLGDLLATTGDTGDRPPDDRVRSELLAQNGSAMEGGGEADSADGAERREAEETRRTDEEEDGGARGETDGVAGEKEGVSGKEAVRGGEGLRETDKVGMVESEKGSRAGSSSGGSSSGGSSSGGSSSGGSSSGGSSSGGSSSGGSSSGGSSSGGSSSGGSSSGGSSSGGSSSGGSSSGGSSSGGSSSGGSSSGGSSSGGSSSGGSSSGGSSSGGSSSGGSSSGGSSSGGSSSGGRDKMRVRKAGGPEGSEGGEESEAKRRKERRGERRAGSRGDERSSKQGSAQGAAAHTTTRDKVTLANVTQGNMTQETVIQTNVTQDNVTQSDVNQGNVTRGNVTDGDGSEQQDGVSAAAAAPASAEPGASASPRALHPACDLSQGTWVPTTQPPLYSGANCTWVSRQWACRRATDRPSFSHEALQWRPLHCDVPPFDPLDFLDRLRHRALAFVGDSLAQQQFQSLLCLLGSAVPPGATEDVAGEWGFENLPVKSKYKRMRPTGYAVRFTTTNTTILFSWSSCLCKIAHYNMSDRLGGGAAMHVDQPDEFLRSHLGRLDVVVMNSAHHWSRGKVRESKWDVHIAGQPVNIDDPHLHLHVLVHAPPLPHALRADNNSSSSSEGESNGTATWGSRVVIEGNSDIMHALQRIALRSTMAWLHRHVTGIEAGHSDGASGHAHGAQGSGGGGGEPGGGEGGAGADEGAGGGGRAQRGRRAPLLLLRTASPRHFFDGEWNTRGHCDHKRDPLSLTDVLPLNSSRDAAAEQAVAGLPSLHLLNTSHLSSFRPDAHPSQWGYLLDGAHQDCLHWCLPGVPDTWNQLLYAHLLLRDMREGGEEGGVMQVQGDGGERGVEGGKGGGEESRR